MSQFTGMDVEAVKQLSVALHNASNDINNIIQTLNPKIHSTQWVGKDQQRFVDDWQNHHMKNLGIVKQALQDASDLASPPSPKPERS